jgi:gamma-glutamyl-gamma-aminobutyrate hydrolase PuuD
MRIGVALVFLIGLYLLVRLAVQFWSRSALPADAPRIAFSLDNTLLGQIGVTDVTYQQALTRVGGRLVTLRPDMAGSPDVDMEAIARLLKEKKIDGVLLTGGGDVAPELYGGESDNTMLVHRLRDDFEIALIKTAKANDLPILGICRGCQILNVALGGTLRNLRTEERLIESHLTLTGHSVELIPESTLSDALGVAQLEDVISLHGQAVDRFGSGLRAAATGPEGVVEAVEADTDDEDIWIVGIQWHPELAVTDEIQNRLFKAFIEQARKAQKKREVMSRWHITPYIE